MFKTRAIAAVGLTLILSACGSTGFFSSRGPDEMMVARQAPLAVPPDFSLQPPRPGAPRPQDADTRGDVLAALFGGPAPRSASEQSVLQRAGQSEPGIRSTVGDPETQTVDKGSTTRDIIAAPQGDGQSAQTTIPQP